MLITHHNQLYNNNLFHLKIGVASLSKAKSVLPSILRIPLKKVLLFSVRAKELLILNFLLKCFLANFQNYCKELANSSLDRKFKTEKRLINFFS